jgi:hypothetical protein
MAMIKVHLRKPILTLLTRYSKITGKSSSVNLMFIRSYYRETWFIQDHVNQLVRADINAVHRSHPCMLIRHLLSTIAVGFIPTLF